MKKIDLNGWERKSHYSWFSQFADPSLAFDVKTEITPVLNFCKKRGLSSFAVIMYAVSVCLNNIPAFRLRVAGDEVWEIDCANAAYTIMVNDSLFMNCRARVSLGFENFIEEVEANKKKYNNSNFVQKEFNNISVVDDIYFSCVPWINFTGSRQPIPDKIPESKSIPRVLWGKYFSEGDKTFVTLNITANHALVDGLDMAKAFNSIQDAFNDIEKFLGENK